jgi:hypothetical protein
MQSLRPTAGCRKRRARRVPGTAGRGGGAPEAQALNGACQLVLAITAARDNDRTAAYRHLDLARQIAEQVGDGRDDYGTEFGTAGSKMLALAPKRHDRFGEEGAKWFLARDPV